MDPPSAGRKTKDKITLGSGQPIQLANGGSTADSLRVRFGLAFIGAVLLRKSESPRRRIGQVDRASRFCYYPTRFASEFSRCGGSASVTRLIRRCCRSLSNHLLLPDDPRRKR